MTTKDWVSLTVRAASEGVSEITVRRAMARGLPWRRVGKHIEVSATAPLPSTQKRGPKRGYELHDTKNVLVWSGENATEARRIKAQFASYGVQTTLKVSQLAKNGKALL
jgi:hypothetical protein